MFDMTLFIGFPINTSFASALETVDSSILELFIQKNRGDYLNECIYRDTRYLGKFAGEVCDLGDLFLLEEHIYSILQKLVPQFNYKEIPLELFPVST